MSLTQSWGAQVIQGRSLIYLFEICGNGWKMECFTSLIFQPSSRQTEGPFFFFINVLSLILFLSRDTAVVVTTWDQKILRWYTLLQLEDRRTADCHRRTGRRREVNRKMKCPCTVAGRVVQPRDEGQTIVIDIRKWKGPHWRGTFLSSDPLVMTSVCLCGSFI